MAVLIEGMEMPKNCHDCEMSALVDVSDGLAYGCQALKEMIFNDRERLPNCPLVPVPPHGRLGDLDELHNHLNEWYLTHEHGFSETEKIYIRAMLSGVKDSPTVIPASEEDKS